MITLNLITKPDRKKLSQHRLTILFKDFVLSFLILSAVLGITLLICNFILMRNFIQLSDSSLSVIKSSNLVDKHVGQINENLKDINKIQNEYTDWVQTLLAINNLIPQYEIQVTNLEIDHLRKKAYLEGKALTREKFLELKQSLEESELFAEIESPLSNILYSKNLNFRLDINLN